MFSTVVLSQAYILCFPNATPYCMRYAAVTGAALGRWITENLISTMHVNLNLVLWH